MTNGIVRKIQNRDNQQAVRLSEPVFIRLTPQRPTKSMGNHELSRVGVSNSEAQGFQNLSLDFLEKFDKILSINNRNDRRVIVWSRNHRACVVCGKTEKKHVGKGKCYDCYMREYQERNSATIKETKDRWYRKNETPKKRAKYRDKLHFDGNREKALSRDGHACQECGNQKRLVVHHKDGNGRGQETPNSELDNLITLCRACHARVHHTNQRWARSYDKCVMCGQTDKPHNAKGYCTRCYHKR